MTIVGGARACLEGHLRLVLGKRIANGRVQIASGGRAIAGLGGSVALVGAAIVFVAFAGPGD